MSHCIISSYEQFEVHEYIENRVSYISLSIAYTILQSNCTIIVTFDIVHIYQDIAIDVTIYLGRP